MNAMPNLFTQIENAEEIGDAAALAAIARHLLAERAGWPAPAPATKPRPPAKAAAELSHLTRTERLALGLPLYRDGKMAAGDVYRYVLVTFANGLRMLTGYYPRAKNPDDLTPALQSAHARYLLALSGGQYIDAKKSKRAPKIIDARWIIDPDELEAERWRCQAMRLALEGFTNEWMFQNMCKANSDALSIAGKPVQEAV